MLSAFASPDAPTESKAPAWHAVLHVSDPLPLAELLLESGASLEARGSFGGTALHDAACAFEGDPTATIDCLVAAGAELEARDWRGRTPLAAAVRTLEQGDGRAAPQCYEAAIAALKAHGAR